jgi:hypothetical protein
MLTRDTAFFTLLRIESRGHREAHEIILAAAVRSNYNAAMIDRFAPHASMLRVTAAMLALAANLASAQAATPLPTPAAGIWKAVVPAKPMHGEFDGNDPLGVAAGAKIKADCSLNWIDPDEGKRYCFSSGTSLEYFLDRPKFNIARARAGWKKLAARPE